jgi:biopolymer transport protein TolR
MAVGLHRTGRPGGGRRGRARRHTPMHEINVTPFVDVMLVLLIVFMVTAPLLLTGLPVELPPIKGQSLNVAKEQLTVTVDRGGRVYLGTSEEPIGVAQLATRLKAIAKEDEAILFRGDRHLEYGRVSEVLNAVIQGGYKKFTFVSGPEEIPKAPTKR